MNTHYVFWTEKASSLFLSGSTVQIFPNHRVVFKNERMAPSLVIHEWHSKYNFQGSRRAAVLPNLKVGKTYRFKLNASVIPEKTIHIKLTFYNQFNERLDYVISTKEEFEVTIPENTYEYGIQLINAGCHTVDFSSIEISDASKSTNKHPFYEWVNEDDTNDSAHVLFVEKSLYFPEVSHSELSGLSNVLIVPCTKENRLDILSSQTHVLIKSRLNELQNKGIRNIKFIGYGALSNFMALAHSHFFGQAVCYITDILLSEEKYNQLFNQKLTIFKDVSTVLSRKNKKNIISLSISSGKEEMYRLQAFLSLRPLLVEMSLISKD